MVAAGRLGWEGTWLVDYLRKTHGNCVVVFGAALSTSPCKGGGTYVRTNGQNETQDRLVASRWLKMNYEREPAL